MFSSVATDFGSWTTRQFHCIIDFLIHDKIMWRVYITGYLLGEEKLQPNKYPYDPPNR